jgi:hypothetical protein
VLEGGVLEVPVLEVPLLEVPLPEVPLLEPAPEDPLAVPLPDDPLLDVPLPDDPLLVVPLPPDVPLRAGVKGMVPPPQPARNRTRSNRAVILGMTKSFVNDDENHESPPPDYGEDSLKLD